MVKKLKRLSKHLFASVSFMIIGYLIIAFAASPFFSIARASINLLMIDDAPTFDLERGSIFDANLDLEALANVTEIHISDIEFPTFGTQYGELRSDHIGLRAPVYWGDSYEILRHGVGTNLGGFIPGFNSIILLAGHNVTDFLFLEFIEVGDTIEFITNYGHFIYEVFDIDIFYRGDAADMIDFSPEEELLIMYTCYPFTISGIPPDRLFVFARRIQGPDIIYRVD